MRKNVFEAELPLLETYIAKKRTTFAGVLANKCFVILLHFLRDLIPFVRGLRQLDAEPQNCWIVAKPYPYAYKDIIRHKLEQEKFNVIIAEEYPIASLCMNTLHQAYRHSISSNLKMILVEDGGHFGEHLESLKDHNTIIGVIEQTTKGYWKYKRMAEKGNLLFPVLSVASSNFKADYEPRFVGRTVVRNLRKFLPDAHLSGKKALLFGYGSVGSMVAHYLRNIEDMSVDVCEVNPKKRLLAKFDNFNVKSDIRQFAEREWYLVIGSTGGKTESGKESPMIDEEVISLLPHGCILLSTSSDQIEIDVQALKRLSQGNVEDIYLEEIAQRKKAKTKKGYAYVNAELRQKIRIGAKYKLTLLRGKKIPPELILLADGYPINFYSSDSVPNESIDPILTAIFLSTVFLASNYAKLPNVIHDRLVDKIIENEKMIETFSRIHGLD